MSLEDDLVCIGFLVARNGVNGCEQVFNER